jgi:hypothetical protein
MFLLFVTTLVSLTLLNEVRRIAKNSFVMLRYLSCLYMKHLLHYCDTSQVLFPNQNVLDSLIVPAVSKMPLKKRHSIQHTAELCADGAEKNEET